jgi:hypothetical protein
MARVDVALADRVKRYAAAHRQPIAVIIRDALILLMEEYPAGTDPTVPHRLVAHEFLSDRYESPLDMLVGETDSAGLEALLSDTHERVIDTILSDMNGGPAMMTSDAQDARADRATGSHAESAETHTEMPTRARSRKVSGRKAAQAGGGRHRGHVSHPGSHASGDIRCPPAPAWPTERPPHQRILTLLAAHPGGLSAHALRISLNADTQMSAMLQRLRKAGVVTTRGRGKAMRYVVAPPSQGALWTP